MPEMKKIMFDSGEYRQLEDTKSGEKIKFSGEATVNMNKDGSGFLMIDSMEMENMDGPATREMKKMMGKDNDMAMSGNMKNMGDDF